MSALPVAPIAEVAHESLAERLGRGRLTMGEALAHAVRIAACLRDLHAHGLVYGAVSSQLIVLRARGAELRSTGKLARLGDGRHDVFAFGEVLREILAATDGPDHLIAELRTLAAGCCQEAPDMQQVLIGLRLLALQAQSVEILGRRPARRLTVVRKPEPKRAASLRFRLPLPWKPLVHLTATLFSR